MLFIQRQNIWHYLIGSILYSLIHISVRIYAGVQEYNIQGINSESWNYYVALDGRDTRKLVVKLIDTHNTQNHCKRSPRNQPSQNRKISTLHDPHSHNCEIFQWHQLWMRVPLRQAAHLIPVRTVGIVNFSTLTVYLMSRLHFCGCRLGAVWWSKDLRGLFVLTVTDC